MSPSFTSRCTAARKRVCTLLTFASGWKTPLESNSASSRVNLVRSVSTCAAIFPRTRRCRSSMDRGESARQALWSSGWRMALFRTCSPLRPSMFSRNASSALRTPCFAMLGAKVPPPKVIAVAQPSSLLSFAPRRRRSAARSSALSFFLGDSRFAGDASFSSLLSSSSSLSMSFSRLNSGVFWTSTMAMGLRRARSSSVALGMAAARARCNLKLRAGLTGLSTSKLTGAAAASFAERGPKSK
mmetsp:Transcript_21639/g.60986  ORF Transcript_21639/g.60986 Transcript_21639/m.60986 type:complete len:242 (-) Transcript_21639:120-845(-)